MEWVGAPAAGRPISFSGKRRAKGPPRGPRGGGGKSLNVHRHPRSPAGRSPDEPNESRGRTQPAPAAVPGPLAPGRHRQHPPAPHREIGVDPPGRSSARWPCVRLGSWLAMRKSAAGAIVPARHRGACASCRCRHRRPRHPMTGRSNPSGAAAPPPDAASHPPAGVAATSSCGNDNERTTDAIILTRASAAAWLALLE